MREPKTPERIIPMIKRASAAFFLRTSKCPRLSNMVISM
jgi:hypothetical protein